MRNHLGAKQRGQSATHADRQTGARYSETRYLINHRYEMGCYNPGAAPSSRRVPDSRIGRRKLLRCCWMLRPARCGRAAASPCRWVRALQPTWLVAPGEAWLLAQPVDAPGMNVREVRPGQSSRRASRRKMCLSGGGKGAFQWAVPQPTIRPALSRMSWFRSSPPALTPMPTKHLLLSPLPIPLPSSP